MLVQTVPNVCPFWRGVVNKIVLKKNGFSAFMALFALLRYPGIGVLADPDKSHLTKEGGVCHSSRVVRVRHEVLRLSNTPAIFQRLMQQIVTGFNPAAGIH